MVDPKVELATAILEFAEIVDDCYRNTTFAEDRAVYQKDAARVLQWIVDVCRREREEAVRESILSVESRKFFSDYWRQGVWGENENVAFEALVNKCRNR